MLGKPFFADPFTCQYVHLFDHMPPFATTLSLVPLHPDLRTLDTLYFRSTPSNFIRVGHTLIVLSVIAVMRTISLSIPRLTVIVCMLFPQPS